MNSETHFVTPINSKHKQTPKNAMGELRLIGGQWKRTKLNFPLLNGLRPTPSRIRETLFNWLASDITRSKCLDLFAGSGALGFEALSRGAQKVWLVDESKVICQNLTQHAQRLATTHATIICSDALQPKTLAIDDIIDIVFCDPPFNLGHLNNLLPAIESLNLADDALIYVESEKNLSTLECPANWHLLKEKSAGDVRYRLYQRQTTT